MINITHKMYLNTISLPIVPIFMIILLTSPFQVLGNIILDDIDIDSGVNDTHRRVVRQMFSEDEFAKVFNPGPLVTHGMFCSKLPIEIEGDAPAVEEPPVKYTIYYLDESTPNTLHIVVENKVDTFSYDYLVVMAVNEIGVPIGHFHLLVCSGGGAKRTGLWNWVRCNKGKDPDRRIRKIYGNPQILYVEADPSLDKKITIQSVFWSWIPKLDSRIRPEIIQFRIAVVQKSGSLVADKYWVFVTHRIKFGDHWKYHLPKSSQGLADLDSVDDKDPEPCYDNLLSANNPSNFIQTDSDDEITVSGAYLAEMFPTWFAGPNTVRRLKRIQKMKENLVKDIKRSDLKEELQHFMEPPSMGSVIRDLTTHTEMYTGCSVVKNCIGDRENCVANKNCDSLVTYRNMEYDVELEDYFRFELQVRLPHKDGYGYAAMGLSLDNLMGDDSVVECSMDELGVAGVYSSWNFPNRDNKRTSGNCTESGQGDNIKDCELALRDNVLACSFYLRKELYLPEGVKKSRKSFDLEKKEFFIFHATGTEFRAGTIPTMLVNRATKRKRKMLRKARRNQSKQSKLPKRSIVKRSTASTGISKHIAKYMTPGKVDLNDLDEQLEIKNARMKYIKWHVTIVTMAFIALLPNGVFVARYFKETWTATMIFNISIWRLVHGTYMFSVIFLVFMDFFILLSFNDVYQQESSAHRICGYVIYGILAVQPFLGIATSYIRRNKLNFLIRVLHWGLGTIVKIFANIVIGLSPIIIHSRIFIGIWIVCLMEGLFNICMHVAMTVLYHSGDMKMFKTRRHSHGKWMRAFNPLPMSKIHKSMPGERRRLLLYLWFQFGTAVFASTIIIPYAGYNSLYICNDDPLYLSAVMCTNREEMRSSL